MCLTRAMVPCVKMMMVILYCENVPYNIIGDNAASDNIGLARPDVQGTTIDAMVIEENEKQDGDFINDNDFINDEVSDEEYSDNEYNDD